MSSLYDSLSAAIRKGNVLKLKRIFEHARMSVGFLTDDEVSSLFYQARWYGASVIQTLLAYLPNNSVGLINAINNSSSLTEFLKDRASVQDALVWRFQSRDRQGIPPTVEAMRQAITDQLAKQIPAHLARYVATRLWPPSK